MQPTDSKPDAAQRPATSRLLPAQRGIVIGTLVVVAIVLHLTFYDWYFYDQGGTWRKTTFHISGFVWVYPAYSDRAWSEACTVLGFVVPVALLAVAACLHVGNPRYGQFTRQVWCLFTFDPQAIPAKAVAWRRAAERYVDEWPEQAHTLAERYRGWTVADLRRRAREIEPEASAMVDSADEDRHLAQMFARAEHTLCLRLARAQERQDHADATNGPQAVTPGAQADS